MLKAGFKAGLQLSWWRYEHLLRHPTASTQRNWIPEVDMATTNKYANCPGAPAFIGNRINSWVNLPAALAKSIISQ